LRCSLSFPFASFVLSFAFPLPPGWPSLAHPAPSLCNITKPKRTPTPLDRAHLKARPSPVFTSHPCSQAFGSARPSSSLFFPTFFSARFFFLAFVPQGPRQPYLFPIRGLAFLVQSSLSHLIYPLWAVYSLIRLPLTLCLSSHSHRFPAFLFSLVCSV